VGRAEVAGNLLVVAVAALAESKMKKSLVDCAGVDIVAVPFGRPSHFDLGNNASLHPNPAIDRPSWSLSRILMPEISRKE